MKKNILIAVSFFLSGWIMSGCKGSDNKPTVADTTSSGDGILPRPSSNSDATNPSIPDTTIIKYDSTTHRPDSGKR